jgi:hypothetical protein
MNALDLSFVDDLPSRRFCNDCSHACKTHCARITPGRHVRWNAFERIGLAEQHAPGGPRNAAYVSWINREWATWRALNGHTSSFLGEAKHAAFDAWLAARHDVPSPPKSEAA